MDAALKAAGLDREIASAGATFELTVQAGDSPNHGDQVAGVCRRIEKHVAEWEGCNVRVTFNLPGTADAAAEPASPSPVVPWTPDSAKLRDLNGSGAHAALLKVRTALARLTDPDAPFASVATVGPLSPGSGQTTVATARILAGRYADLDPAADVRAAVIEAARALGCAGATPQTGVVEVGVNGTTALSDLLRLEATLRGLSASCESLGVAVSLQVGLLAGGESKAGLRVTIALLGEVASSPRHGGPRVPVKGERLILLGEAPDEIGASSFLAAVHGLRTGEVPAVDFAREKKLHDVLLTLHKAGIVSHARGLSAGGLLGTVAEMVIGGAHGGGARVDLTSLGGTRADALLFGESQGRAVLVVPAEKVGTVLAEAHMRGVPAALIGELTAEPLLDLKTRSLATAWNVAELRNARQVPSGG